VASCLGATHTVIKLDCVVVTDVQKPNRMVY
jgi:hypothetical protein